MALTLSNGTTTITLPSGMLWEDELSWEPIQQTISSTLTGAVVVEEWTRLAGRPMTYVGGQPWVRITRTELLALQAMLAVAGVILTLTHHDGRTFRVTPRRGSDGPALDAKPWPQVAGSGFADPAATDPYTIERLRLIEVPA
jgi:hypothetical protein